MASYDQYGFNKDKTKYDLTQINTIIDNKIKASHTELLNSLYPIGRVVFLTVDKNPSSMGMPGTWSKLDEGYFIRTTTSASGVGNKAGSGSITLRTSDLPVHAHRLVSTSSTDDVIRPNTGQSGGTGAQYLRCRLIRTGTGTWEEYSPGMFSWVPSKSLPMKLKVRRGNGNETPNVEVIDAANSAFTVKSPDKSFNKYSKLFDPVDPNKNATDNYRDYPDTFSMDITSRVKIDGWTSDGIYNSTAAANGEKLAQTAIPNYIPKYCGLIAWKRTS